MAKNKKKKEVSLLDELKALAEDLNVVIPLEPPIDLEQDEADLKEEIIEIANEDIVVADDLKNTSWVTLDKLEAGPKASPKEKEEIKEIVEEKEETEEKPAKKEKVKDAEKKSLKDGPKEKEAEKESAKKEKEATVKKTGTKKPGIGSFIIDIITKDEKISNEDVVKSVLKEFPDANTKPHNVSWYRNSIK